MNSLGQLTKRNFSELIPANWFQRPDEGSILVTVYDAPSIAIGDVDGITKAVDFPHLRVRAMLCAGELGYLDASELKHEFVAPDAGRYDPDSVLWRKSPEGVYLTCLAPLFADGNSRKEAQVQNDIGVVVALFVSFFGKSIAFKHLYDNVINLGTDETTAVSAALENPWWNGFGSPDLSDSRFESLAEAGLRFGKLPMELRNRIELSLRWFGAASRETDVDAYIKYWIALETLGMPDTTNIRPLQENLAAAYGMTFQQTVQFFRVKKLYEFRCRIVHRGELVPIGEGLLKYLEALYVDLLFHKMGVSCERRGASVLSDERFGLSKYFQKT